MSHLSGATLIEAVDALIGKYHLLGHPFYRAWQDGTLSKDALKLYAAQYYKHVAAFPGHLRALAERTEGGVRELVLENLAEEENPDEPHPMLWRQFAHALGVGDDEIDTAAPLAGLAALDETYDRIAREGSVPAAIAAFYAYEAQIPEIAAEKIKGLKDHFGVTDREGLAYFGVHARADKVHRAQWRRALEGLPVSDSDEVLSAVEDGLKALWSALDACNIDAVTCH